VLLLKCCYFFRRKIQFTLKTKDSTIVVPERINQQRMVVEIVSQPIVQQFTLPEQSRQTYHWQPVQQQDDPPTYYSIIESENRFIRN